jgi:hypothetical protein
MLVAYWFVYVLDIYGLFLSLREAWIKTYQMKLWEADDGPGVVVC